MLNRVYSIAPVVTVQLAYIMEKGGGASARTGLRRKITVAYRNIIPGKSLV